MVEVVGSPEVEVAGQAAEEAADGLVAAVGATEEAEVVDGRVADGVQEAAAAGQAAAAVAVGPAEAVVEKL